MLTKQVKYSPSGDIVAIFKGSKFSATMEVWYTPSDKTGYDAIFDDNVKSTHHTIFNTSESELMDAIAIFFSVSRHSVVNCIEGI